MSRKSPPAYPKVPPHTFRLKKGKVCERRPCSIESYKDASSKCVSAEDRKMKHLRPMSPTAREASSHTLVNADEIEHAKRQSPRVSDESSRSNFTFDPLRCLPIANLDPPITQTILTELDVPRIMDDLAFRHHLNFGLSITFRPNLNGPGAQERTKRAIEYWDAMAKGKSYFRFTLFCSTALFGL